MAEFDNIRSKLYRAALEEFPEARLEDIELMKKYLKPAMGEVIVEVGAGSGFFSGHISDLIGANGKLIVTDPSNDQLEDVGKLGKKNIEIFQQGAEKLDIGDDIADAIWSFGAMHHCFKKEEAFKRFYKTLKKGGRLVIGDVFEGSKLARHFNEKVDKYCITGHKVEFWTDKTAKCLCKLGGFNDCKIIVSDIKWKFGSKKDVGDFLCKLHAMTKTNPEECLRGAEKILGIKKIGGEYYLNWPMKFIVARK
jgi:arsenite methyltransferase